MENLFDEVKIENGSRLSFGQSDGPSICTTVQRHFNWFQKRMLKICFGLTVEDYSGKFVYFIISPKGEWGV